MLRSTFLICSLIYLCNSVIGQENKLNGEENDSRPQIDKKTNYNYIPGAIKSGHSPGIFGPRTGILKKRALIKNGSSKQAEVVFKNSLRYLARQQNPEGYWGKKSKALKMTSITMLPFLSTGNSDKVGKYKEEIRKGLTWLIAQQKEDGSFHEDLLINYLCSLVIIEASAIGSGGKKARQASQLIIKDSLLKQNIILQLDSSDSSKHKNIITIAHYMRVLISGLIAGIQVKEIKAAFRKVASNFTQSDSIIIKHHSDKSLLALELYIRIYLGHERSNPRLKAIANFLLSKLPEKINEINRDEIYIINLALFQFGSKSWKVWNKKMKKLFMGFPIPKDEDLQKVVIIGSKKTAPIYDIGINSLNLAIYYRYFRAY